MLYDDIPFGNYITKHRSLITVKKDPASPKKKRNYTPRGESKSKTRPRVILSADIESTTEIDDCRVWEWGYVNIANADYDNVICGKDFQSFVNEISQFNSICYFHNLKFDGNFIIYWMLTNDFMHLKDRLPGAPETFTSLINAQGHFYTITVKWATGFITEFRDSFKKIPMSVADIGPAFNLDMKKGEIDYRKPRPIGYEPTKEEVEYLKNDICIVGKAMKNVIDNGMDRLTVGSDALNEFRTLYGEKKFRDDFPVLEKYIDIDVRRALRGGFTYADPRFKHRKLECKGFVFDVNSLYPYVMITYLLPYGKPIPIDNPDDIEKFIQQGYELSITQWLIKAKIKPDHIPCIQLKHSMGFIETEYLTEINEITSVTMTNVDWELVNKHYDVDYVLFEGGWAFKGKFGTFDKYIEKWATIKMNSVGGQREIAKLFMNSLFGKFTTNPDVTGRYPVLEDGRVKFKVGKPEEIEPIYTAMGVFITAYARSYTITHAQLNYDVFAYADTDSLHLLTDEIPDNLIVHPTEIGAWKEEYIFDSAFYLRAKAYIERLSPVNKHSFKCDEDCEKNHKHIKESCPEDCPYQHNYVSRFAGLSRKISATLTFDDIVSGNVIRGGLKAKVVPGGVVLVDSPYEIKF